MQSTNDMKLSTAETRSCKGRETMKPRLNLGLFLSYKSPFESDFATKPNRKKIKNTSFKLRGQVADFAHTEIQNSTLLFKIKSVVVDKK